MINNYPQGFIGTATPTATPSQVESTPQEDLKTERVQRKNTDSYKAMQDSLVKQIRKRERALRDINEGKVQASDSTKRSLENQLDLYTQQLRNLKRDGSSYVTVKVPQEQSARDVTFDASGNPVSKAYSLQSPEERQRTNDYYAKFISTKDSPSGSKYVGGTNDIRNQSDNRFGSDIGNDNLGNSYGYKATNQYAPRTKSPQETIDVYPSITTSVNYPYKHIGGTISAYSTSNQSVINYSTPYDLDSNSPSPFSKADVYFKNIESRNAGSASALITTPYIIAGGLVVGAAKSVYGLYETGKYAFSSAPTMEKVTTFTQPQYVIGGLISIANPYAGAAIINIESETRAVTGFVSSPTVGTLGGVAASTGETVALAKVPEVPGYVFKTIRRGLAATAEYRAPESVFAREFLENKGLPKTGSIGESLDRFNRQIVEPETPIVLKFARDEIPQTNMPISLGSIPIEKQIVVRQSPFIEMNVNPIEVAHASPKPISSTGFPSENIAVKSIPGTKSSANLEDTGIYVTPKGEASGGFLGLGDNPYYQFSFNPFAQLFNRPTITETAVKGVELQPRNVVLTPGFEASAKFFEDVGSKSGKAYITKRSEIGQGNIPRQKTIARESGTFWRRKYVEGQEYPEPGTKELEGVIPKDANVAISNTFLDRIRGGQQFTKVKGEIISIKKGTQLAEEDLVKLNQLSDSSNTALIEYVPNSVPSDVKIVKASEISSGKANVKYVTPNELALMSLRVKPSESSTPSSKRILSNSSPMVSSYSKPSSQNISELSIPNVKRNVSTSTIIIDDSSTPDISNPSNVIPPDIVTISIPGKTPPERPPTFPPSEPKPPEDTPPPTIPTFRFNVKEDKKKRKKVTLFVKRKGKFENRGVFESESDAFRKGVETLSNTASASFKVKEDNRDVKFNSLPRKFRASKKDSNVVVQKREFRIGSFGEKQEITYKGIAANRRRLL